VCYVSSSVMNDDDDNDDCLCKIVFMCL
jgi:hypothetical protein